MYITVKSIKRDLGFKRIELSDLLIGFPIVTIFLLLFSLTNFKVFALVFIMVGIFLLMPIYVSKKNRMYKIIILIFEFIFRKRNFVYSSKKSDFERRVGINELRKITKYWNAI